MILPISDEVIMYLAGMTLILFFATTESTKSLIYETTGELNSITYPSKLAALNSTPLPTTPTFSSVTASLASSPHIDMSLGSVWVNPTPKPDTTSSNSDAMQIFPQSKIPKKISIASRQLSDILSPSIFTMADPFQYLVRETTKLTSWDADELLVLLESLLKKNQIPENLMPYVRAEHSIIQASVVSLKRQIIEIWNDPERSTIPSDISSPPALSKWGLFSQDIFSDPEPPIRLLNALVQIRKDDIPNLSIQLKNYIDTSTDSKKSPEAWLQYRWYATKISSMIRYDYVLNDLKRNMAKIQRISTTGENLTENATAPPHTDTSSDTESSNPCAIQPLPTKFEDLRRLSTALRHLSNLLSPKSLSTADLSQHLIRETCKLPQRELIDLEIELQKHWTYNEIPDRCIPYSQALQSIIRGGKALSDLKWITNGIQRDRADVPTEVSSPPSLSKYGLFSSDVFSDPNPPTQVLSKLLRIPKDEISDLLIQLRKFKETSKKWRTDTIEWRRYVWHAETLIDFLINDSILDDMKRDMAKIQPISTSNQNLPHARTDNKSS